MKTLTSKPSALRRRAAIAVCRERAISRWATLPRRLPADLLTAFEVELSRAGLAITKQRAKAVQS